MYTQDDLPTSGGAEWMKLSIAQMQRSIDRLTDEVSGLHRSIAEDQTKMRESFSAKVSTVEVRVAELEKRVEVLKRDAQIAGLIGAAIVVALVAIAVPRLWGQPQQQQQPAVVITPKPAQ